MTEFMSTSTLWTGAGPGASPRVGEVLRRQGPENLPDPEWGVAEDRLRWVGSDQSAYGPTCCSTEPHAPGQHPPEVGEEAAGLTVTVVGGVAGLRASIAEDAD